MIVELLISLLVAVHLLAMNVASAGPLVAVALRSLGGQSGDQPLNGEAGARLVRQSAWALAIGVALGGLALAGPSTGMYAALSRFPSRAYWFAGAELLFSGACLVLMNVGWLRWGAVWLSLVAFVSASNLLYHFPPLMAALGNLAADPNWTAEQVIDRAALLRLFGRAEVLSLSIHFGLASIAVSAVLVMRAACAPTQSPADRPEPADRLARRAARWALWPTLLQLPVGAWVLIAAPGRAREALMGGDLLATASFAVAVVGALLLIQTLATVALGESTRPNCRRALWLTALVVLLMTISLRSSRLAANRPSDDLAQQSRVAVQRSASMACLSATNFKNLQEERI